MLIIIIIVSTEYRTILRQVNITNILLFNYFIFRMKYINTAEQPRSKQGLYGLYKCITIYHYILLYYNYIILLIT
jgi:hypothetical protein